MDGVGGAGHRRLHQVGQKAVELGPGVDGPGDAAAAKAAGGELEVAPVFLGQEVGSGLRDPEQRMGGAVDRHRGVDARVVGMVLGKVEAGADVLQRQRVRQVAVDLVGRDQNEARPRGVAAGCLEQVEGPEGVDLEVGVGLARRPVVGGLGGGVDHELEPRDLGEGALDCPLVADVGLDRAEGGVGLCERVGDVLRRGLGPEEASAHVVLDPDDVVTGADQTSYRFRADEAPRSRDYGGWHQRKSRCWPRSGPCKGIAR